MEEHCMETEVDFCTSSKTCYCAVLEIRGTPPRQAYFKFKKWEFSVSNLDLLKMGILKTVK